MSHVCPMQVEDGSNDFVGAVDCASSISTYPGPNPRAWGRGQNKKRRGLRFLFRVVSIGGYVSYFGWFPRPKPRAI